MNDPAQKPVSTLAIAEKRPQRPGGCVGIFFQLFDWNKRLAKKKLFSRKLLPSSRLKRAAKKFGGADNLPGAKLRLIADENRGGFPKKANAESPPTSSANVKHCKMQTPNLVARLMGLESMPVVPRNQSSKKVLASELCNGKESFENSDIYEDGNQCSEKRNQRFELRPQKLQKTGFLERAPVSKLGAEALQFRNVLLRSRKQHKKLASPVKRPRIVSGRRASRLMETATKILEPSLEATNRAKRFLRYSAVPRSRVYGQEYGASAPSVKPTWKEDNRCNSCGHLVNVNLCSNIQEQVPEYSSTSDLSSSSGRSRPNPKFCPPEDGKTRETGRPLSLENQHSTSTPTVQTEQNVKTRSKNIMDREVYLHKDLGNSKRTQSDVAFCKAKHNNQKQNAVWASKDLRSPKAYIHQVSRRDSSLNRPSGTKDYVALNRNLASQSRAKMHVKVVENNNFDESATANRMTEISARVNSLDCKRRSLGSSQFYGMQAAESAHIRGRNRCNDNKQLGLNAQCAQSSLKHEIQKKAESGTCAGNYNADTVPFTFSSSARYNNRSGFSRETMEKTQNISRSKKVSADTKNRRPSIQREKEQGVDALGALLEQKLRELTHLDMDESEKGVGLVGRSTAAILEELISALTTHNVTKENADDIKCSQYYGSPDKSICQVKCNQMSCSMIHSQGYSEGGPAVNLSLAVDSDNPSPTSIFEACFSNDSNCSHSPDSGSGSNFRLQFAESSLHGKQQQSSLETDKWDSASLMHIASCGSKRLAFWKNDVASINYFNKGSIELSERNFGYSCEDIWHADFWFGTESHIVDPIFIKKVQAFTEALEANDACGSLGFADSMTSNNQYKRFLVDFVMEYMVAGSAYYHQHKPTCWAWAKLPFVLTTGDLIKEVCREISKWKVLAGKVPDEIVEWELRRSTGFWNTSELESFKMCTEIEGVIFQILIDEMVVDL